MRAKFTEGPVLKHICTMTFASMVGLMSLFLVDLVDMYWLSLLGEIELAAAIGYSGSILFFTLSLSIGLSIGCGAVVSHSIGLGDKLKTQQLVANILLIVAAFTLPFMLVVFFLIDPLLSWLGADGRAFVLAHNYMKIVLPSMPIMAVAMAASGVMRAIGNAKEAMYLTLIGGGVNACLDPIFIFSAGLGIEGAAIATVCARIAMLAYGIYLVAYKNTLISMPNLLVFSRDVKRYCEVAIPAVLTNLSTPIGIAYVTATMAQFGDSAVAGNAIVGKIQPLAFAGLFALSGSVGPIVGQNLGAKFYERIAETFKQSCVFVAAYCFVACGILWALTRVLIYAFQAQGDAAALIYWFCWGLSSMFVFTGMTFVTNAFFNNLKVAHWATAINFAKATVFTIPFAYLGAKWAGPLGIYIGLYLGTVITAVIGVVLVLVRIKQLPKLEKAL